MKLTFNSVCFSQNSETLLGPIDLKLNIKFLKLKVMA